MAVKATAPKAAAPRIRRISRPSLDERLDQGRTARDRTPPSSHAGWSPAADRPDPVGLLEQQDRTREPDLVPVRHGRMMVSPFTFYRGAAKIMAVDLKDTPAVGLRTQLCGDAHLSNFGMFASPERRLMFDLNDFDEVRFKTVIQDALAAETSAAVKKEKDKKAKAAKKDQKGPKQAKAAKEAKEAARRAEK